MKYTQKMPKEIYIYNKNVFFEKGTTNNIYIKRM